MLYIYDNAIVDDLNKSFNGDAVDNPVVRVVKPEQVMGIAAQLQDDSIHFPIVALSRSDDISIDTSRTNFTMMHKGVPRVFDGEKNQIYYERVIPVDLNYKLTVLTTNTADMDEIIREIMFKYVSMYFLTVQIPYEGSRKIRFGIQIDSNTTLERSSGSSEALESGSLYQSILSLKCVGCVLVNYVPSKLIRNVTELDIE